MALDVISFSIASKNRRKITQVDKDVQQPNAQYPYEDIYPKDFDGRTLNLGNTIGLSIDGKFNSNDSITEVVSLLNDQIDSLTASKIQYTDNNYPYDINNVQYALDEVFRRIDNITPWNEEGSLNAINALFSGSVIVQGNLNVLGTEVIHDVETVLIKDNLLTLNNGEFGSGVSALASGIEIDRGLLPNYVFIFDEETDTFRVGEKTGEYPYVSYDVTQAVATREDNPFDSSIPFWNDSIKRFDTTSNLYWNNSLNQLVIVGQIINPSGSIGTADSISYADSNYPYTIDNVQGALDELYNRVDALSPWNREGSLNVNDILANSATIDTITVTNYVGIDANEVKYDGQYPYSHNNVEDALDSLFVLSDSTNSLINQEIQDRIDAMNNLSFTAQVISYNGRYPYSTANNVEGALDELYNKSNTLENQIINLAASNIQYSGQYPYSTTSDAEAALDELYNKCNALENQVAILYEQLNSKLEPIAFTEINLTENVLYNIKHDIGVKYLTRRYAYTSDSEQLLEYFPIDENNMQVRSGVSLTDVTILLGV